MRIVIGLLTALTVIPYVTAEPVTLRTVTSELSKRNADSIQVALLAGVPQIQARIDDQGVKIRLTECDSDPLSCQVVTFSSCREYISMTEAQAIAISTEYDRQDDVRGNAFVGSAPVLGQKLCIRSRTDLHIEDKFDIADIFDWQLTMRDFFEFSEATVSKLRAEDIINYQLRPSD